MSLELDKDIRFLIRLDIFFLITIVSSGIIHDILRNHISVLTAIFIGLIIATGGIVGMTVLLQREKKKNE